MQRPRVDLDGLYEWLGRNVKEIMDARQAAARKARKKTYSLAVDTRELSRTPAGRMLIAAAEGYFDSLMPITGEADCLHMYYASYLPGFERAKAKYSEGAVGAVGQERYMDQISASMLARGAMFLRLLELWTVHRRQAVFTADLGGGENARRIHAIINDLSPWAVLTADPSGGATKKCGPARSSEWTTLPPPPPTPKTDLRAALAMRPPVSPLGALL